MRVYNRYGRPRQTYKARIKILVKAEAQRSSTGGGGVPRISPTTDGRRTACEAELDRVRRQLRACPSGGERTGRTAGSGRCRPAAARAGCSATHAHRLPGDAVTLAQTAGQAPGDITADQMDRRALADRYSRRAARHARAEPAAAWVRESDLWKRVAAAAGWLRHANIGLITDMIACPGGDFCALANARSIRSPPRSPSASPTSTSRTTSATSTCTSAAASILRPPPQRPHRHPRRRQGRQEWYQVTLGGAEGDLSGRPGRKVIGPSFAADEVPMCRKP